MRLMTTEQDKVHQKFQEDLRFFSKNAPLLIKPAVGMLRPLLFNKAQLYLHDQIEKQRGNIGKVRILVVKARKEGVSTYVGARFFHHTTRRRAINSFILTHDAKTTAALFNMVKVFQENIHPSMRPDASKSNEEELVFPDLNSSYDVGTAGNKDIGRGRTIQRFHGSEVAFWKNARQIRTGILEAIPDQKDTEIILESTANGIGNLFHEMVMTALEGRSDYIVVFIPWFWMKEYQRDIPKGFKPSDEELELKKQYSLTLEQLAWRRAKIENLGGAHRFKQEYPSNVHEAFETSGSGLIRPAAIMQARKSSVTDKSAPLVMGVDPARTGDRTVIVFRRGREVPHFYKWDEMQPMQLAGIIANLIDKHHPAAVFIDKGEGFAVADRLHELGYEEIVHGVGFGDGPSREEYLNKRAEMWCELRDWLHSGEVKIPDNDEIHKDLAVIPDHKFNSSGRILLPKKDDIKKEHGFSPDIGDALALTFAFPVRPRGAARYAGKLNRETSVKTLSRQRSRRG